MLLSVFLVSSIFLTNTGQILVYASEAHTPTGDEEENTSKEEIKDTSSIDESKEEVESIKQEEISPEEYKMAQATINSINSYFK